MFPLKKNLQKGMTSPQSITGPFVTVGVGPERFHLPVLLIISCFSTICFIIFLVLACFCACKRTNLCWSTAFTRGLISSSTPLRWRWSPEAVQKCPVFLFGLDFNFYKVLPWKKLAAICKLTIKPIASHDTMKFWRMRLISFWPTSDAYYKQQHPTKPSVG